MGPMMYWFLRRVDDHEKDQPSYYFRMFDPDFTPHPVYAALKEYIATARWLGIGFHQEGNWTLDYAGPWSAPVADPDAAAGEYRTGAPGARLAFTFHGTGAELALLQNPYGGVVSVSVDGRPAQELDLRVTDPHSGGRIVLARGLVPGAHRVELTVTRGEMRLDGIVIRRTAEWLVQIGLWIAAGLVALGAGVGAFRRWRSAH